MLKTDEKYIISPIQLYCTLFLIRLLSVISISYFTGYKSIQNGILHIALELAVYVAAAIPVFLNKNKRMPKALIFIYCFFVFLCVLRVLLVFGELYNRCAENGPEHWIMMSALTLCAIGASVKGLEGITRASLLFAVFCFISFIFIIRGMVTESRILNISPEIYEWRNIMLNFIPSIGNMLALIVLPGLVSHCPKAKYKGYVLTSVLAFLFEGAILTVVASALGRLCEELEFPVFYASIVANAGIIRRMDFVLICVFILCVFTFLSLLISITGDSVSHVFNFEKRGIVCAVCGISAMIICMFISYNETLTGMFMNKYFWIVIIFVSAVVLPIFKTKKQHALKMLSFALTFSIICLSLGGCAYINELDERLIINGIAVDKNKGEYDLSFITLNTDTTEGTDITQIVKSSGITVTAAVEATAKKSGKYPYMGKNLFVLFGESCTEQDIKSSIHSFAYDFDSRSNFNVFYTNGNASDILNEDNQIVNPQKFKMLADAALYADGLNKSVVDVYCDSMYENADIVIPLIDIADGSVTLNGAMGFSDDGKKVKLTNEDVVGIRAITGDVSRMVIALGSKLHEIKKVKTDMSFIPGNLQKQKVIINVRFRSDTDSDIYEYVSECCKSVVKKCKDHKCDCISLKRYMYLYNNELYNSIKDVSLWLREADFEINIFRN
ncbi:MAG: GerAB/ArcD/ProY family transporter [Clostridiales bacterium]|nr:GerAB/ArcD/ProY family transporter [Clostridiales bacterium]